MAHRRWRWRLLRRRYRSGLRGRYRADDPGGPEERGPPDVRHLDHVAAVWRLDHEVAAVVDADVRDRGRVGAAGRAEEQQVTDHELAGVGYRRRRVVLVG